MKLTTLALPLMGLCLSVVGIAHASGAGGACKGEWQEKRDPTTGLWSLDIPPPGSSPSTYMACPTANYPCGQGKSCAKMDMGQSTNPTYPGYKQKMCACKDLAAGTWTFDTILYGPPGDQTTIPSCDVLFLYAPNQWDPETQEPIGWESLPSAVVCIDVACEWTGPLTLPWDCVHEQKGATFGTPPVFKRKMECVCK